ncbi:peptidase M48 [Mycolicibacterium novocastrense]|uniref:M56 family metallopeptidase n=1 Tax=Mycobacteriaceae TaxID=1762 RepID=UPI0007493B7D|nr:MULTISPECIES: M56 family metallopeptidase [Mycobacteriaceae]KUH64497.1 peptidase M48 [Mycolicibacterium novocastrense]KUH64806.1 peptidase M48 [Mycolicibacterium novocastrense]KUH76775.1 peptidase M48 [Mycolicibacterium novocastrense]OBF88369.1 peptidase M48 [Mycobacterium sp. 852002-51152_SCH6134967]
MNVAACLLLYSLAVIVAGPPVLVFLTRGGHAPRCGVAAWLIAIASVLLSWLTVVVLVIVDVVAHWHEGGSFVVSCVRFLCDLAAGKAGTAPQMILLASAAAVVGAVAVIGIRFVRVLRRLREHASGHAEAVRLVGRPTGERDVYVVDAPERTAYCVGGKPPAIVVTTAAVGALGKRELAAVLAHERAHLDGRHPRILTALRGLALVFSWLGLMTRGATEVSRLLEMCADDAAARRHGKAALLAGLMALAAGAPAAALGAADIAVLNRAERLAIPAAHHVRVRAQAALTSATAMMAIAPLGTLILGISGVLVCG